MQSRSTIQNKLDKTGINIKKKGEINNNNSSPEINNFRLLVKYFLDFSVYAYRVFSHNTEIILCPLFTRM